ncbi:MAG: hypothetical protein EPN91_07005 [Salinibacterium sp.]|nr:MAG: hypothetical protein EPN91_07005 [Salinibacterium sp.]
MDTAVAVGAARAVGVPGDDAGLNRTVGAIGAEVHAAVAAAAAATAAARLRAAEEDAADVDRGITAPGRRDLRELRELEQVRRLAHVDRAVDRDALRGADDDHRVACGRRDGVPGREAPGRVVAAAEGRGARLHDGPEGAATERVPTTATRRDVVEQVDQLGPRVRAVQDGLETQGQGRADHERPPTTA